MNSVSIIIYSHNEEKNIEGCVESAKLLSNVIILIDAKSTDNAVKIAKRLGANCLSINNYLYVEPSREYGIRKAKNDWVLILDADERITQELAYEIKNIISQNDIHYSHFKIPRKNIFGKIKWLKHGGWWPDYIIRLINKKYFKSWPKDIHSTPIIEGNCGYLQNPILHYFHGDIENMVDKTVVFENIESDLLYGAKKNVSTLIFFRKFLGELYRRLVKNLGFLDGNIGIIESIYQAFSKTITYLFLYEKSRAV